MDDLKLRQIYRIENGILSGTEIEPFMATVIVRYPHRKTADLYVPPIGDAKNWHCCQDKCAEPDFEGDIKSLIEHLMLHKGRLLKHWSKKHQLKSPIPAVKLPANPWNEYDSNSTNQDRRFCISLYMDSVKRTLKKQGLEILEAENP